MLNRRPTRGFTLVEILVVVAIIALLAALLLPAISFVRELSRRSKCTKNANQIVLAQQNYNTTRAGSKFDSFVTSALDLTGNPLRGADGLIRSDGSKAFIAMSRRQFIDTLAAYACPSDPFIAVLDATGRALSTDVAYEDFPTEGQVVPNTAWSAAGTPAQTETGHTYFSYSQQTRAANQYSSFSPKMDAKIPIVGDRNPYSIFPTNAGMLGSNPSGTKPAMLAGVLQDPLQDEPTGNPYAHNRGGTALAYMDGRSEFLEDARNFTLTMTPTGATASGYQYIYSPNGPIATPPGSTPAVGGAGAGRMAASTATVAEGLYNQTGTSPNQGWGVWLTD